MQLKNLQPQKLQEVTVCTHVMQHYAASVNANTQACLKSCHEPNAFLPSFLEGDSGF